MNTFEMWPSPASILGRGGGGSTLGRPSASLDPFPAILKRE